MADEPFATLVEGIGANAKVTPLTQDEYESFLENGMIIDVSPVPIRIIFVPTFAAIGGHFQVPPNPIFIFREAKHISFSGVFPPGRVPPPPPPAP